MTADLIRLRECVEAEPTELIAKWRVLELVSESAKPSPAEGDAGLTDEQANALAAFYDVSPGTVRDIYALSKPKAAEAGETEREHDWPKDPAFDAWWDSDRLTQTNPYAEGSPVFWAWEGWQARIDTQPKGTALAEALRRLLKGNEWKELQGEWAWHTKSMPGNADLTLAREALEAHDAQSPAPSLPKGTAVDLTDDDIITELHRHTQRYTDDRLDYIIDPSEAVAFARAAIAADRALQATAPAMHSTALAGLILTHLGYSTEPSLEPGADMRRDALARRLGEWLSPATQAPAPAPGTATFGALKAVTAEKNKLNRALELACGYLTEAQVAEIAALMPEGDVLRAPAVAPQKPLTDAQIEELKDDGVFYESCKGIVREIERLHGISVSKPPVHSTGDGNA